MKITADTNVLVRALVQDDPEQARAASAHLEQAELVAVPLPVLCELVWVLRRVYRFSASDCIGAIEALLASASAGQRWPAPPDRVAGALHALCVLNSPGDHT